METSHKIIYDNAKEMKDIKAESVDLIVTSPPYPMIEMWDELFGKENPEITEALKEGNGNRAFELMHKELDKIWSEVYRVLKKGGIACINIGDATRSINGVFQMYPNNARIINFFSKLGFQALPNIIWVKETNKPNKFMGSGMLPASAYVTLEHEYILIFRKGDKREFKTSEEKLNRHKSAYFWEERNVWYSDMWRDIKGTLQKLNNSEMRDRSGAFPFELAYRLINMFSVQGDIVLDPFLGTGTTLLASMVSERNSIGYEIERHFKDVIEGQINELKEIANIYIDERLEKHRRFVEEKKELGEAFKYLNRNYNIMVKTSQEIDLIIPIVKEIKNAGENSFKVEYSTQLNLL